MLLSGHVISACQQTMCDTPADAMQPLLLLSQRSAYNWPE